MYAKKTDPKYAEPLSRLRTGESTVEDFDFLHNLEKNVSAPDTAIHIFMTNLQAGEHKSEMLRSLDVPIISIVAHDSKESC